MTFNKPNPDTYYDEDTFKRFFHDRFTFVTPNEMKCLNFEVCKKMHSLAHKLDVYFDRLHQLKGA